MEKFITMRARSSRYQRNQEADNLPNSLKPVSSFPNSWWRHEMETFSVLLALCEGNPLVTGGFPSPKPVTQSLTVSLICAWARFLSLS